MGRKICWSSLRTAKHLSDRFYRLLTFYCTSMWNFKLKLRCHKFTLYFKGAWARVNNPSRNQLNQSRLWSITSGNNSGEASGIGVIYISEKISINMFVVELEFWYCRFVKILGLNWYIIGSHYCQIFDVLFDAFRFPWACKSLSWDILKPSVVFDPV